PVRRELHGAHSILGTDAVTVRQYEVAVRRRRGARSLDQAVGRRRPAFADWIAVGVEHTRARRGHEGRALVVDPPYREQPGARHLELGRDGLALRPARERDRAAADRERQAVIDQTVAVVVESVAYLGRRRC